jgi:acyl-homoserine-lactone acylase
MRRRRAGTLLLTFILLSLLLPVSGAQAPRAEGRPDPDAGKTVVYRDEYGVPHIYAPSAEAGMYAMGYCQAQDRLEELLKNYMRGMGEVCAAVGQSEFMGDLQSRVWRHYEIARKNYGRIRPEVRRHIGAFVAGINDYLASHQSEIPSWWGERKVDIYMPVAHARYFLWGWPVGQALGELQKAGVYPNLAADMRSSNEMAIAPSRTSVKAPILIIDPHLSFWGPQRFWEFRIHAGELRGSGFTLPGSLYVGLGHTDFVAWAMTTGGPDTADIYRLTLNPENVSQYRYDGAWRALVPRTVTIAVKGEARPRELTVYDSHYGPIVAKKGNEAFAAKLSYAEEVQFAEAFYMFNIAKNVADFRRGLDLNQLMPQNVMAADTGGNIYYQRAGRVPIRPEGFDFSQPLDGSGSKTEWRGIHPASDLIAVENPPQGYMQNCNVPPDVMMVGSPMTPDKYKPYLFNERAGRTHQRAAQAVNLLKNDDAVTPEEAMAIALDRYCYQFDRWTEALKQADQRFGSSFRDDADYQAGLSDLLGWNGYSTSESTGALKFYYWRQALRTRLGAGYRDLSSKLTDYMTALDRPREQAASLSDSELQTMNAALAEAMRMLKRDAGSPAATFGQVFRVGRDRKSWPVGGGSLIDEGMATVRAIGFGQPKPDHTRWADSGQTSTQVVVLTRPVRSWTQPPIGQSDRPDSPYYSDQAEKLFSQARMKPSWYEKSELLQHVRSRTELKYAPR